MDAQQRAWAEVAKGGRADEVEGDGEEEDGQPAGADGDPSALKQRLDAEEATVQLLMREGKPEGHPTMRAATAARDSALRAWKAARQPHPVGRRIGWAQRRLDRALKVQDRIRGELADFDQGVREQRAKITERLDQARERIQRHRSALEELQEEAGAEICAPKRGGGELCARLAGGMRDTVAPNVAALAAALPADSEASRQMAILVGHLEGMQRELEAQVVVEEAGGGHQTYNIADDGYGDGLSDAGSGTEWSESHEIGDGGGGGGTGGDGGAGSAEAPTWRPRGHGRWNKVAEDDMVVDDRGDAGGGGQGSAAAAGSGGVAGTQPAAAAAAAATAAAAAAPTPATPVAGTPLEPADGDDDGRPNKARRGQGADDTADAHNAVRATALQCEQQAAIQAAGQMHAQRVAGVVAEAIRQGVQPITEDGEDLIMLDPQGLAKWANSHLTGAAW